VRLFPGAQVDRYVLEQRLGSGGMAEVWAVRHAVLGTRHALKVLLVHTGSVLRRTVQEGQVQARLRHPNLVPVTDVLDLDGAPGLLMELVEGPTLADLIARGPIERTLVDRLAQGILSGMALAHAQGVVHRDLKPSNVLVASGPDGPVARVTDFGIAKVLDEESGATGRTREGSLLGTPAYMAPEQTSKARDVDARADVFALGAVLYELVSGRRAFPQDDLVDVVTAIREGRVVPLSDLTGVPFAWYDAIRSALLPDRDRRPADAAALLARWNAGDGAATSGRDARPVLPVRLGRKSGPTPPAPPVPHTAPAPSAAPAPPAPPASKGGPLRPVSYEVLAPLPDLDVVGGAAAPSAAPAAPRPRPPPAAAGDDEPAWQRALGPASVVFVGLVLFLLVGGVAFGAAWWLASFGSEPLPPPRPIAAPAPVAPPPAPAPPRPAPAAPRARGTLRLYSSPSAEVRVDGRAGADTRTYDEPVAPGAHTVNLTAHGTAETVQLQVVAQADQATELCWDFGTGTFCTAEVYQRLVGERR
jgi:serine/threonine protein kinase